MISLENEITSRITNDKINAGSWKERFGIELVKATINSIELSDKSKELLHEYAARKVELSAYSDIPLKASDIAAQQKIAQGIQEHGLGNMGGMIFGMNIAQNLGMNARGANNETSNSSINQQLELLKKLKDALDDGILTQEEFDIKKKEVLGL